MFVNYTPAGDVGERCLEILRGENMDLNNVSVFNLANKNLQYLAERQRVLAENIANANTPGYLPKDVKKPDFFTKIKPQSKFTWAAVNVCAVMRFSYSLFGLSSPCALREGRRNRSLRSHARGAVQAAPDSEGAF